MRLPTVTLPLFLAMVSVLSACTSAADVTAKRQAADLLTASRDATACRNTVAAKPRYQGLARHMPLEVIFDATLLQMTDTAQATADDVVMLGLWLSDTRECRRKFADALLDVMPTALPVLAANWNKDDKTFVQLAMRKLTWGQAVIKIRENRAEMLDAISHQILQLAQQLNAERQAELSRRVAIFNALTNLSP